MYRECLIGFDCRQPATRWTDPKGYDPNYLMNPEIDQVLGVSHGRWSSVTNLPGNNRTDSAYWNLPLPTIPLTPMSFWYGPKQIKQYMKANTEAYHGQFWLLAFTLVDSPLWRKEYKNKYSIYYPCLSNISSTRGSEDWKLLGYDVEGTFAFSGLGRGWVEEYHQPRKARWGAKLNRYNLFANSDDAAQYASWHLSIEPGVYPLMAFGLYLVEEITL